MSHRAAKIRHTWRVACLGDDTGGRLATYRDSSELTEAVGCEKSSKIVA